MAGAVSEREMRAMRRWGQVVGAPVCHSEDFAFNGPEMKPQEGSEQGETGSGVHT